MDIGIQDDNVLLYPYGLYDISKAYSQAGKFGATWVRFNVIWGEYARFCRQFKGNCFKPYDDAVAAARANGFRVQLTITGTPAYEPFHSQYVSYRRPNATRFRIFAARVARRYKGKVFRYSLWNEPNLPRWITPSSDAPRYYTKLVRAAYPAIKRIDRRNQVLMGEFTSANDPLRFMQRMGRVRADGLAYHPFEFFAKPGARSSYGFIGINSTPLILKTLRALARARLLSTPAGRALPLYYTEFGYQSKGRYRMTESTRRTYLLKAFQVVTRYPAVKEMLQYMLIHPPRSLLYGDVWDSALIGRDGKPDPAYTNLVRHRHSFGA